MTVEDLYEALKDDPNAQLTNEEIDAFLNIPRGEENMALTNDFGDSKVTIEKQNLLSEIKKNREKHVKEYTEAMSGYKKALIQELATKLDKVKEDKEIAHCIETIAPQDHSKDYDRVIKMLEMSTADSITITESQFSQYVLDEWNWQRAFKASTAMYNNRG